MFVPVVSMTPENGSTEVWPGTHRDTTYSVGDGSARIPEAVLAPYRERRPPSPVPAIGGSPDHARPCIAPRRFTTR